MLNKFVQSAKVLRGGPEANTAYWWRRKKKWQENMIMSLQNSRLEKLCITAQMSGFFMVYGSAVEHSHCKWISGASRIQS